MTTTDTRTATTLDAERQDLLDTLGTHRALLLRTLRGLDDEQARRRTTVSTLTLGGIVQHVAATEAQWTGFIERGTQAMARTPEGETAWASGFSLAPGETLAQVLERYAEVARSTDQLVRTLPDLDASHPLPAAPWFPPGAAWSARRVLLHLVAETAQHAGHADLLRESLDGAKTMG